MTADGILIAALLAMSTGRVPMYVTAVIGGVAALLAAGVPLMGDAAGGVPALLKGALRPLPVVDMLGILLFIGVMKQSGCMEAILYKLMESGRKHGGAPGVAAAAGFAAALLGTLSAFTQPYLTAASAGPAAIRLGMPPHKAAGMIALSNALANACGFTHPTVIAILTVTGVSFGEFNLWGFAGGVWILIFAYLRVRGEMGGEAAEAEEAPVPAGLPPLWKAVLPFAVLCGAIFSGVPIFLAGLGTGLFVCALTGLSMKEGENAMMSGISIPIMAALSLYFMAEVMEQVGFIDLAVRAAEPFLSFAPVQMLFLVSALAGLFTQSMAASAAIVLPVTQIVMEMGCDPMAVTFAAVTGCAVMQLFLTGGAVTSLSLVVKVVPGASRREANLWQRPIILADAAVCFLLTFLV